MRPKRDDSLTTIKCANGCVRLPQLAIDTYLLPALERDHFWLKQLGTACFLLHAVPKLQVQGQFAKEQTVPLFAVEPTKNDHALDEK